MPVFAGTRVPIAILIDYLKAGDSLERFLDGFPTIKRAQAIAFLNLAAGNCSDGETRVCVPA